MRGSTLYNTTAPEKVPEVGPKVAIDLIALPFQNTFIDLS